jgi:hypothetical protein
LNHDTSFDDNYLLRGGHYGLKGKCYDVTAASVKTSTCSYVAFVPEAFGATHFPPRRLHPPSCQTSTSSFIIVCGIATLCFALDILTSKNDGTKEENAECVKEERRALVVAVKEERRALVVAIKEEERRALVVAVIVKEQKQEERLSVGVATQ